MNEIVTIKNLNKEYRIGKGKFHALKNISLEINSGEFTGIIGPSGSGKTTLLNIIGTLDKQSSGNVRTLGWETSKLSARQSAKVRSESIGFIFQTYNLLPVYTVYENVEFPLLLLNISKNERRKSVLQALEWVGLTERLKSKPAQLSGGECQRVAIARAMVKNPILVLADEPTANLDSENSHNILQVMKTLNEELKTTFIFSTHDDKVIKYLNRRITLSDGSIIEDINL